MKRAETYDEIKPLIALCKAGKLFEVQEWIASGKPANGPPSVSGHRRKGPLEISIDLGFHSLKWFIDQGADVETDNPIAYAFCNRIKSALGVFKTYKDRFPSFQEQANIALRHHCRKGNLKWVSLMLWAGADPYSKGPDHWAEDPDPEYDQNALELAARCRNFEIFNLKAIRLDPSIPELKRILLEACHAKNSKFLEKLLAKGFKPSEYENEGTPLIHALLTSMCWCVDIHRWDIWSRDRRQNRDLDNGEAREKIKMIHILAKHGAKWHPGNQAEITEARRSLLKMKADYTVEFIWIMAKYQAAKRQDIEELIRTPSIRSVLSRYSNRITDMIKKIG